MYLYSLQGHTNLDVKIVFFKLEKRDSYYKTVISCVIRAVYILKFQMDKSPDQEQQFHFIQMFDTW